ncbi:hypothetical protein [Clavibacter capsici]|uniref:hypothetical protein n=1 Tax=Clavibacter capsici TaxID=1874630 RepID=UPI00142872E5|nr:hypothetical protein [Clavibacter capsici]QIS38098.1 hypothetical protein GW572_01100 [Clavibacter capsici]
MDARLPYLLALPVLLLGGLALLRSGHVVLGAVALVLVAVVIVLARRTQKADMARDAAAHADDAEVADPSAARRGPAEG